MGWRVPRSEGKGLCVSCRVPVLHSPATAFTGQSQAVPRQFAGKPKPMYNLICYEFFLLGLTCFRYESEFKVRLGKKCSRRFLDDP